MSFPGKLTSRFGRLARLFQAAILLLVGLLPLITSGGQVSAAQLTNRVVAVSTSQAAATGVAWDFEFDFTSTDVEGIIFTYCDSPVSTCVKPTGLDISNDLTSVSGQANFPANATAFVEVAANTGDCSDTGIAVTVTMYCVNRTSATAGVGTDASLVINAVINPTVASTYTTVYVRISLYDNSTFSNSGGAGNTLVHSGVVAATMVNQLTVSGRVQERLVFCVGALGDIESNPTDCTTGNGFPTDTTVDLGVIDNTTIARSPVNTGATTSADDDYGVAMVNTNAVNGVVVTYYAEAASSGSNQLRNFRVSGTTCSVTISSLTDQCFVAADDTNGETFSAGTERFGMQVTCIVSNQGIGTTNNLEGVPDKLNNVDDDVDGNTATDCEDTDTGNEFSWNITGTATTVASSAGSTDKVVDDELIKLRFGATASATTPTGVYAVTTTFIATATF